MHWTVKDANGILALGFCDLGSNSEDCRAEQAEIQPQVHAPKPRFSLDSLLMYQIDSDCWAVGQRFQCCLTRIAS